MADREKVIKGIHQHCEGSLFDRCGECPYYEMDFGSWEENKFKCRDELLSDALALLKEQEPIPCGEKIKAGDVALDFYKCGCCKNAIRKPWRYCPFCGKAVKWE